MMIRYALSCSRGHGFDSWFRDAAAFDALAAAGQIACAICGDTAVGKTLMAPAVAAAPTPPASTPVRASLSEPASQMEKALADLRRQVEANSEYVGMNFVAEARAIHDGERPERSIYGEARPEEARKLLEDGVPVAALPFLPGRKTN